MRHYIKLISLMLPMAVLVVAYQQCSGVSFQNANQRVQWSLDCQNDASKCQEVTETFNSGTSNKKIDFTWIIDNSASMSNEIATVRNNMANFANRISQYADLKMAVISAKDSTANPGNKYQSSPYYINLEDANLPNHIPSQQVNSLVKSTDALILGALALCPSSGLNPNSWCAKFQAEKRDDANRDVNAYKSGAFWNDVYKPTISSLKDFLREQSHKVFVIVTDDNAGSQHADHFHIKTNNFLDAYNSRFPNAQPVVYSIIQPKASNPNCNTHNQGTEYIKLSNLTGGGVFDICESNWGPFFDEMLDGIETLAKTSFPLATVNIIDILSVKIYNPSNPSAKRELFPGEYILNNRTLTVREDIIESLGYLNFQLDVKILAYTN